MLGALLGRAMLAQGGGGSTSATCSVLGPISASTAADSFLGGPAATRAAVAAAIASAWAAVAPAAAASSAAAAAAAAAFAAFLACVLDTAGPSACDKAHAYTQKVRGLGSWCSPCTSGLLLTSTAEVCANYKSQATTASENIYSFSPS
jgi:hypothetical protein